MKVAARQVEKVTLDDWKQYPVWTFDLENESAPGRDETWMIPVQKLPVTDLRGCGCLAKVTLAGGRVMEAVLWGVRLNDAQKTKQIVQAAFWLNGNWWHLNTAKLRHSSIPAEDHDNVALARILQLKLEEIFPITYDISDYAVGEPDAVRSCIDEKR